ncbi:MAG: hypothetical protein M1817_001729 [Caeruleum heppii]|nr:MAG: hypothetical protein M1817_001729 [Caeruleum heppii]
MYWPIGAPRVYSRTPNVALVGQSINSGDGDTLAIRADQAGNETADGRTESSPTSSLEHSEPNVDLLRNLHLNNGSGQQTNALGEPDDPFLDLQISRSGRLFVTITATELTVWQARPVVVLATVIRTQQSRDSYGSNVALSLRPDSAIVVVQTSLGYLVTYSIATEPGAQVYEPRLTTGNSHPSHRQSAGGFNRHGTDERVQWGDEGRGTVIQEVNLRFRMVIKIDAGIACVIAMDEELVVATLKPAAMQCIRWTPDAAGSQTCTQLLSNIGWLPKRSGIAHMFHDRPMNLSTWVGTDGTAYAVQRIKPPNSHPTSSSILFNGYGFHTSIEQGDCAVRAAVNARFSLIAVGCVDGRVCVYTARDYMGNIPLSFTVRPGLSSASLGSMTSLSYSPDGYCLFAGFTQGWQTWSVFGQPGCGSHQADRSGKDVTGESWLTGVQSGTWLAGGTEMLLVTPDDTRLWVMEMARSAVAGCLSSANISRPVIQTTSGFMLCRGYDDFDMASQLADVIPWHHVQIPDAYLTSQWPIKCVVVSSDGRYVAVAGRRGLAHYSVSSGRWKTFVDEKMANGFTVRGGMSWHQHVLIAAVESGRTFEIRLYSREVALDDNLEQHIERLSAPVVVLSRSGDDSLLVYTYENILYHYIISAAADTVKLVLVGQIALHGIVRSPPRVRAISWILPDDQLRDGDPSRDVAVASIFFLVDGKLVLLQPSFTEEEELRYDMRVLAQSVEYYALTRDQAATTAVEPVAVAAPSPNLDAHAHRARLELGLRDSLWIFDGSGMRLWLDVHDLLKTEGYASTEVSQSAVPMPVDFYPLSIAIRKGVLVGIESELLQRRDMDFALFRIVSRAQLFLPQMLRHLLRHETSSAAVQLSQPYQHLPYFSHALEILLHDVLDEEADMAPATEDALLPRVLSFLSSFPDYLDIIVQCTRKTEARSWRTLFAHLPSPRELFEESLQRGLLKTAGGYLLVLHTFEELSSSSEQLIDLLFQAKQQQDWDLCMELARFLMALNGSGETLREALDMADLRLTTDLGRHASVMNNGTSLACPWPRPREAKRAQSPHSHRTRSHGSTGSPSPGTALVNGNGPEPMLEYFPPVV